MFHVDACLVKVAYALLFESVIHVVRNSASEIVAFLCSICPLRVAVSSAIVIRSTGYMSEEFF